MKMIKAKLRLQIAKASKPQWQEDGPSNASEMSFCRIKCNLVGVRRLLPLPTLLLQATALRNLIGFIDRFSDSHFPSGLLSAVCVQSMSQPMSFSSFKRSWTSRIFIHDVIRCFYGYGFFCMVIFKIIISILIK